MGEVSRSVVKRMKLSEKIAEALLKKGLIKHRWEVYADEKHHIIRIHLLCDDGAVSAQELFGIVNTVSVVLAKQGYKVANWGLELETWADCDPYWGEGECAFAADLYLDINYK